MINAAERFVYVENQYLTSAAIRDAFAERLRHRNGPEIVVILPRETGDWLEQHTMAAAASPGGFLNGLAPWTLGSGL